MTPTASIIIPTFNNPHYLDPCLMSIRRSGALDGLCELIVVNNGIQNLDALKDWPNTQVIRPGKNLGWEAGLEAGIQEAKAEFLCFQNDDTFIPKVSQDLYQQLLWPFQDQQVAAVGPATTVAAGWHSVFNPQSPRTLSEVTYLIFFTAMIRRSHLDLVGGIDTAAPGGDDLDLCMRFRKAGKSVMVNPDAFLIHHGFKTGERVRGAADQAGGWNSKEMTERTNRWLIQKHGFKTYMESIRGFQYQFIDRPDVEGQAVASYVRGPAIYELGCGFKKTVPQAIGIDRVPKGQKPSHLHSDVLSVADIQADVTKALPVDALSADTVIARHILEHCLDPVETLHHWNAILKMGARLVIAVPFHGIINSIPLNPEHVHAYTPESLSHLVSLCGFRLVETKDPENGISFVACFEKVLHQPALENGHPIQKEAAACFG